MKKIRCIISIVILVHVSNISAQTVYVNNFNNKYHTKDCPKVNSKYFAIDLKEALNSDYNACNVCNPPTKLNPQNIDNDIQVEFSRVIKTDSVGKTNLFVTINDWFATNFKSANDVIQMADKEAGVIIGKGNFSYSYEIDKSLFGSYKYFSGFVDFTIKVYIKDNRYKVELFNFSHKAINNSGYPLSLGEITNIVTKAPLKMQQKYYNDVWNDIILKIKSHSESIFISLEKTTKEIKNKNDDGW